MATRPNIYGYRYKYKCVRAGLLVEGGGSNSPPPPIDMYIYTRETVKNNCQELGMGSVAIVNLLSASCGQVDRTMVHFQFIQCLKIVFLGNILKGGGVEPARLLLTKSIFQ